MSELSEVAPAFVEMAHRIVWCSAGTVDSRGRQRSRTSDAFAALYLEPWRLRVFPGSLLLGQRGSVLTWHE